MSESKKEVKKLTSSIIELVTGAVAADKSDLAGQARKVLKGFLAGDFTENLKERVKEISEFSAEKSNIDEDTPISLVKALESDDLSNEKLNLIYKIFMSAIIKNDDSKSPALFIEIVTGLSAGEIITLSAAFSLKESGNFIKNIDNRFISNSLLAISNQTDKISCQREAVQYSKGLIHKGLFANFDIIHKMTQKVSVNGNWEFTLKDTITSENLGQNFILSDLGVKICEYISDGIKNVDSYRDPLNLS